MKSFKDFLSESINIAGDFNGNLYLNSSDTQSPSVEESFFADIVWEGRIYRLEVEGSIIDKNSLAEQIQSEYPGAIVHNVYPAQSQSSLKIKNSQRYQPEKLSWTD